MNLTHCIYRLHCDARLKNWCKAERVPIALARKDACGITALPATQVAAAYVFMQFSGIFMAIDIL